MNFIYTLLLFLTTSIAMFVLANYVPGPENLTIAFYAIGTIALVVSFITLLACFFQNMYFQNRARTLFNQIRESQRDQDSLKAQMEQYKNEVSKSLTELYPDYEKEIFKSINPNDAEHLSALMMKYPELKFNGVLEKYTSEISSFISSINKEDREINRSIRSIEDLESSGWMLGSIKKPEFFLKLIK